jgi:hypothetical protein
MAGPINFTINYTCSPNAVSGILEYRHLQPDATWTNWTPDLAAGNPFAINTQGGTVLNQTLSNIPGNGTDFIYNTTYDFRIKQTCDTGVIEYSNISSSIYTAGCPHFEFLIDKDYSANSGYAFIVRLYDNLGIGYPMNPNLASISSYVFDIKTNVGGIITSIGSFTIPITAFTPGAPYFDFPITSNDLTQPIESLTLYYLDVSFYLYDGRSIIYEQPCRSSLSVTTPPCSTYRIYANEFFVIEYTDCSGKKYTCGTTATRFNGSSFYICSQSKPRCYSCIGGAFRPTISPTGITVQPNQLFVPGVTPFQYDPVTGDPVILYGALVELVQTNACDSNFNGELINITTAQVGSPWYRPYPAGLPCNTPACTAP